LANFLSHLTRCALRVGSKVLATCSKEKGRRPMPTPSKQSPERQPPVRGFTTRNRSKRPCPHTASKEGQKRRWNTSAARKRFRSIAGLRVRFWVTNRPSAEPVEVRVGESDHVLASLMAHFRKNLARARIASRIDHGMVRPPCRPRKLQRSKGRIPARRGRSALSRLDAP
jgi:hypothetical protein